MENSQKFTKAKQKALSIMSNIYDPLHDDKHVLEVENTAIQIYKSLDNSLKKRANIELIRLACVYHDTSRKYIKSNVALQPILDGYLSGKIAYKSLQTFGYSKQKAKKVQEIINSQGIIPGHKKRKPDVNGKVFADADLVEGYSLKRFMRAAERFQNREFSILLLNKYALAMVYIHTHVRNNGPRKFYFQKTQKIYKNYVKDIRNYVRTHDQFMRKMLYKPVYKMLRDMDFLRNNVN